MTLDKHVIVYCFPLPHCRMFFNFYSLTFLTISPFTTFPSISRFRWNLGACIVSRVVPFLCISWNLSVGSFNHFDSMVDIPDLTVFRMGIAARHLNYRAVGLPSDAYPAGVPKKPMPGYAITLFCCSVAAWSTVMETPTGQLVVCC